ncbi:hypothetical protein ZWY2020_003187 [Hordeum vulgare]|nr:hypothetical protein ZWY2020_003187 [Hordeum vulgare]
MENYGLVTYQETALLFDERHSAAANKQRVAVVVAHELAHQWFGNLVTMEWWTHLWLNEGFATWLSYLAADRLFPEWNVWIQFLEESTTGFRLDALGGSHPIEPDYGAVYMERCYDLLEPKAKEIMALDDKLGNLQLKGLAWAPVRSEEEFQEVYLIGVQSRKAAHTGLNDVSCSSHAVLSIRVSNDTVKGKLNLIDLAALHFQFKIMPCWFHSGTEDDRKTCNEGIHLQESSKINSSLFLFALSHVISALKKNNESRVPYRESKLTLILQDSLGGNSRAVMITCVNPVAYQEAVHTINMAARSGHMMTNMPSASKEQLPKVKVDMEAKLQLWLESKGKTKSVHRMNGLLSPTGWKPPFSMRHMKQPLSARVSGRAKAMDQDGANIKNPY